MIVTVGVDFLENVGHWWSILDAEALDFENERRLWWNAIAGTDVAVTKARWNGQLTLLAGANGEQSIVPTFDHLAHAQLKLERFVAGIATFTKNI